MRNFDVQNRNAEISLEKRNDFAKIGMVGISDNPAQMHRLTRALDAGMHVHVVYTKMMSQTKIYTSKLQYICMQ